MSRYTAITDADREAMLAAIGVASVQELFERQVPGEVRLDRPLELPEGMGEAEVYAHLKALADMNVSAERQPSFLGAGMYDHYVPAIVDALCERSEFLTPYTPYQPEVSQGGLQAMFEYQTAISELTALPVSNASVYEGPSAVASAGYLAKLHNGRPRFVVSAGLHPHTLQTLRTYAHGYDVEIVEVGLTDGVTDAAAWREAIDADTGAAIFAQPNFYGAVEDAERLAAIAKEAGTGASRANGQPAVAKGRGAAGEGSGAAASRKGPVVIAQVDPITLGVLKPPGECGVDVAVGEGQPLGGRLDFGGPSFGFFAAREEFLRRIPGRIAGETVDLDGRRGFVLTLQTREQHIRRERATSNICTAQALNALAGVIYLSWLGRRGIVELGELLLARTHYARARLCAIEGVEPIHTQPAIREFAVRLPCDVAQARALCIAGGEPGGVNPGADLQALTGRPQDENGLLVAITERRSRQDIDRLADALGVAVREVQGTEERQAQGVEVRA